MTTTTMMMIIIIKWWNNNLIERLIASLFVVDCAPLRFSSRRTDALVGFQNGEVGIYLLKDKTEFGRLGAYWSRWAHDQDSGDVTSVAFSHDHHYAFTTGLDGNFFAFMTPDESRFTFGEKTYEPAQIPSEAVYTCVYAACRNVRVAPYSPTRVTLSCGKKFSLFVYRDHWQQERTGPPNKMALARWAGWSAGQVGST